MWLLFVWRVDVFFLTCFHLFSLYLLNDWIHFLSSYDQLDDSVVSQISKDGTGIAVQDEFMGGEEWTSTIEEDLIRMEVYILILFSLFLHTSILLFPKLLFPKFVPDFFFIFFIFLLFAFCLFPVSYPFFYPFLPKTTANRPPPTRRS